MRTEKKGPHLLPPVKKQQTGKPNPTERTHINERPVGVKKERGWQHLGIGESEKHILYERRDAQGRAGKEKKKLLAAAKKKKTHSDEKS